MNKSNNLNLISFIKSKKDTDAINYIKKCNKVLEKNYLIESKKQSLYKDDKFIKLIQNLKEEDLINNTELCKKNFIKLICTKTMISEILKYQLEHIDVSLYNCKNDTLTKAANVMEDLLKKYQWKAGGFYINDIEWEKIDSNMESEKYDVGENEILLLNTIDNHRTGDEEIDDFLQKIIKVVDNMTSSDIKFEYDISKINKKISAIMIWISKN